MATIKLFSILVIVIFIALISTLIYEIKQTMGDDDFR